MVHFTDLTADNRCLRLPVINSNGYYFPSGGYVVVSLNRNASKLSYKGTLVQLPGTGQFGDHDVSHQELYGTLLRGARSLPKDSESGLPSVMIDGRWVKYIALTTLSQSRQQTISSLRRDRFGYSIYLDFGPVGTSGYQIVESFRDNWNSTFTHIIHNYAWIGDDVYEKQLTVSDGAHRIRLPFNYTDPSEDPKVRPGRVERFTVDRPTGWAPEPPEYTKGLENMATRTVNSVITTEDDGYVWGQLSQDIANNAKAIDTNLWTTIPELYSLKDGILENLKVWQKVYQDKTALSLSNAYLSTKYGPLLTIKDCQDQAKRILDKIRLIYGSGVEVEHSRATTQTSTKRQPFKDCALTTYYALKAYLKIDPLGDGASSIIDALSRLSAMPRLTDAWDMVPFSFVADWFADFEGLFSAIDARVSISTLPVFYTIQGKKTSVAFTYDREDGYTFTGSYENYNRFMVKTLVLPKLELELHPQKLLDHIPEETALIIQQASK